MFERNIKLFEPVEFVFFLFFFIMYYAGVRYFNLFERFDYDAELFIAISIVCLLLGVKKYTANSRGISRTSLFLPLKKKTITWDEIKHLAHVTSHKKDKYDNVICSNIICFIDFEDKIRYTIKDKTRQSQYDKKTESIIIKKLKPPIDYGYFIKLVKSREETFETDLVMSSSDIRFGAKVNYNQTTYINKKKKSIF